jgi:dipeptidyl aminopeptidase/acylaminoacyl peptidase
MVSLAALTRGLGEPTAPAPAQEKKAPTIVGPRYVAYDHNTVIHLFDRLGELKPPGKGDDHPHIPEHYTFCMHPCLSGDAEHVALAAVRPLLTPGMHSLDVYVWDRKSNKVLELPGANSFEHDDHPSISADGNLVAFHTTDEAAAKTAGVRLYDRTAKKLLDLPGLDFQTNSGIPSISPEGRYLVFSARTAKGDRDIYLYDREAKKLLDMPGLNSPADEWSARLSKGGRWLAFASRRGGQAASLHLYDREAGKLVDLPNLDIKAGQLECDLSADGQFLAVLLDRRELRLYDRQAGKLVELPGLYHQGRIQFSPSLSRE